MIASSNPGSTVPFTRIGSFSFSKALRIKAPTTAKIHRIVAVRRNPMFNALSVVTVHVTVCIVFYMQTHSNPGHRMTVYF